MTQKSQRTLLMIENFFKLHEQGLTILEIADQYGISRRSVYNYLDEIAKKHGVSREYLLEIPHKKHISHETTGNLSYIFDTSKVSKICNELNSKVLALIQKIDESTLKGENCDG